MPVGPSYCERWSSNRSISESSEAVPISGTGRECGTSASRAPSEIAIVAPNRSAMPVICSENRRQRSAGSGPSTRITSVPGSETDQTPTVGHTIERLRSSSRRTCGRTVAKSVNASGSISARTSAPHDSTIVRHRRRGSVAGVVPAGETGDQHGPIECRLCQPSNMLGSHGRHAIGAYRGADAAG